MVDEQDYFLSIDNGTQSIRAIVFDKTGREITKIAVPITPYYSKALSKSHLIFGNLSVRQQTNFGK